MTIRLGLISWAAGALLLVAISACSDNVADPSPVPSDSPSPSAPTTSASPTSPSDAATADATVAMREYFAVVDEVGQDPAADLKQLKTVATSTQLSAVQALLRRQHQAGQRQTGSTAIGELTVQSINLDNSDPETGRVPTVVFDVCWDVSNVDLLDKDGKSIISPSRPDSGWTRYTVANYTFSADPSDGWRVASGKDLKQEPCATS